MGVMLSVLLSYMGAIEVAFIVRDVTHQLALHQMRLKNEQRKDSDINKIQSKIKASIDALDTLETVKIMQDGVLYENGYRINTDNSTEEIAQQWNDRRKSMCINEPTTSVDSKESEQNTIKSNGSTEIVTIPNERTKNIILNEYDKNVENSDTLKDSETCEPNNCRPIVRDDRTERSKAFKKRHSSSSQSSDSIRLSREEELKMFTSLEEEERNNSKFTPISYSNESVNSRKESSFQEPQRYDDYGKDNGPWGNVKPSNYHNSELWKRESATFIVEERDEGKYSTTKRLTYDKQNSRGVMGTADKPTRKTSCENDHASSELIACLLIDRGDDCETSHITLDDENTSMELIDEHSLQLMGVSQVMKGSDTQENLNEYFVDVSDNERQSISSDQIGSSKDTKSPSSSDYQIYSSNDSNKSSEDRIGVTMIDATKSRDTRSTTVYSRSDSESSNVYHKSISRDSNSTNNELSSDRDYLTPTYYRTDSSNSSIQDELDSEEYHHNHRFSMTADTLEYIRGRDDWRMYKEQKFDNGYRRQSSSISVREEIDSDEYHHDRVLSDLIEMVYLDADNTQSLASLPSSFEDNKVFERYYLELEQIKDHLTNDIHQDIAQKQVVLLDSNELPTAESYLYPLPDIVFDQIDDHDDERYTIEIQLDSDYGNVTSDEDDIQSVIEVSLDRDSKYDREIIATLDVNSNINEMIEVTLWDLKDDLNKDVSSRESSVEIVGLPIEDVSNEQLIEGDDFEYVELESDEKSLPLNPENSNNLTDCRCDNVQKSSTDGNKKTKSNNIFVESNSKVEENLSDSQSTEPTSESIEIEIHTGSILAQNFDQKVESHSSASSINRTFIEHEKASSSLESTSTVDADTVLRISDIKQKKAASTNTIASPPISKMKQKKVSFDDFDDLIKDGSMGMWFHK